MSHHIGIIEVSETELTRAGGTGLDCSTCPAGCTAFQFQPPRA